MTCGDLTVKSLSQQGVLSFPAVEGYQARERSSVQLEFPETWGRHFEIAVKFEEGVQEIEINDVGRAGYAAVERMVEAFQEMQEFYEQEKKGRA